MSWVSDRREKVTCPECGVGVAPNQELPHFMLDVVDITSSEDTDLGLVRVALRCQGCGYAQAFVGRPVTNCDISV